MRDFGYDSECFYLGASRCPRSSLDESMSVGLFYPELQHLTEITIIVSEIDSLVSLSSSVEDSEDGMEVDDIFSEIEDKRTSLIELINANP